MKALGAILVATVLTLADGCASQVQIKTPLPADVRNPLPPQPGLPEPVAAFVGAWAGRWNRIMTSFGEGAQDGDITLVVENIMPATDETYPAYVTIAGASQDGT